MIKVAYDHQIFAWQHVGGISRYICELAKRLRISADFQADVISPLHFNRHLKESGIPIQGCYIRPIPRIGTVIRIVNDKISPMIFSRLRPDVVHETYYHSSSMALRGTPTVLTVHDMIHERFPEHFRSDDATSREKRVAVARADRIICVSQNTKRDLVEILQVPAGKISVIYHGYSFNIRASAANALPQFGRPFLLYVGHRGGWKNFRSLLDAYASSPWLRREFALIVFGGGAFGPGEMSRIQRLGLSDSQVRQISGDDSVLATLYRNASLFVYPSYYEGFGIPLLEAMSLDCPVACSNTSSIPEVAREAAQFFDPKNVDSIRSAIEKVLSESENREYMVKKGRERIKEFSWDRCATETMRVYRELVGCAA